MSESRIEITGNIEVHHPVKVPAELSYADELEVRMAAYANQNEWEDHIFRHAA